MPLMGLVNGVGRGHAGRLWPYMMLLGSGCSNGSAAPSPGSTAGAAAIGGTATMSASGTSGLSNASAGRFSNGGNAGVVTSSGEGGASGGGVGQTIGNGGRAGASTDGPRGGKSGEASGNGGFGGEAGNPEVGGNGGLAGGNIGGAGSGESILNVDPMQLVITGVRGTPTPAATTSARLQNAGTNAISVTALTVAGKDSKLFQIASPPTLPAAIPAGGDLSLAITLLTTSGDLPAAPPQDSGSTALSATLDITLDGSSIERGVSGLVLTTATHEPTLGQILGTLGYVLNVGAAQDNANPNSGGADSLPGIEKNTDEIAAPLFQKAGAGDVTLTVVARFSPKGPMPFGWYPKGAPTTRNTVGTMAQMSDAQTSDKARMVLPPLTGGTSFDPGTTTFGIWVYSDQASQKYDTGGTATNGDYDYSEDGPNSPANVHRTKVYPLKDASGPIPNAFLLAVEEAANGDYQDYVFVLGNATVAQ